MPTDESGIGFLTRTGEKQDAAATVEHFFKKPLNLLRIEETDPRVVSEDFFKRPPLQFNA